MLVVQYIGLTWGKECRGAPYTIARKQVKSAYLLPESFYNYRNDSVNWIPVHYIGLIQWKSGIEERVNVVKNVNGTDKVQVGALEIVGDEDGYQIRYRYNLHDGLPRRQKFDLNNSGYTLVDELAMQLNPGEYGRVAYNGRFVSYDDSYYKFAIINLINMGGKIPPDLFITGVPDKEYKQIAQLY